MKKIALIPTLFTLGNGVCGFASLTFAVKAAIEPPGLQHLATAGWLILAAMVFDVLDGHMARFAKSTTDFGGQLDSLCDKPVEHQCRVLPSTRDSRQQKIDAI